MSDQDGRQKKLTDDLQHHVDKEETTMTYKEILEALESEELSAQNPPTGGRCSLFASTFILVCIGGFSMMINLLT